MPSEPIGSKVDLFATRMIRNVERMPDLTLRDVLHGIIVAECTLITLFTRVLKPEDLKDGLRLQHEINSAHMRILDAVIDELYPERQGEMRELCRNIIIEGLKLQRNF